jgi:MFS family permease
LRLFVFSIRDFKLINRITALYQNFPKSYWLLIVVAFIDSLGSSFLYPFFALYATQKFGIGMADVGIMFAIFAITNLIGNFFSGAVSDAVGRKPVVIFSLIASALSSLLMGLINQLFIFYIGAGLVGLFGSVGAPTQQVMIADLLPQEKRTEGFSIWRMAFNLSMMVGPVLGGLIAARSFVALFIADAVFSLITAALVIKGLPEIKPPSSGAAAETEDAVQSLGGYRQILRDGLFLIFMLVSILINMVGVQLSSTLSVFLRDVHTITPEQYGILLSINATMVVTLQFWITRRLKAVPLLLSMALGSIFYAAGFALYGFVSGYLLFIVAIIIITVGEMILSPSAQSLVIQFAPENMRGRYMALYELTWFLPFAAGSYAAGYVIDNYNPLWVWYLAGVFSLTAAVGFLYLHYETKLRFKTPQPAAELSA